MHRDIINQNKTYIYDNITGICLIKGETVSIMMKNGIMS